MEHGKSSPSFLLKSSLLTRLMLASSTSSLLKVCTAINHRTALTKRYRGTQEARTEVLASAVEVQNLLSNPNVPRMRFLSSALSFLISIIDLCKVSFIPLTSLHLVHSVLHSPCTVLPLLFTAPLFREVMARYRVNPAFLSIVFSMGEAPHPTERGSSYFTSSYSNESRASELQYCAYELQYIEDNKR